MTAITRPPVVIIDDTRTPGIRQALGRMMLDVIGDTKDVAKSATDLLLDTTQRLSGSLRRSLAALRHTPVDGGAESTYRNLVARSPEEKFQRRLAKMDVWKLAQIARSYPRRAAKLRRQITRVTNMEPAVRTSLLAMASTLDRQAVAAVAEHQRRITRKH